MRFFRDYVLLGLITISLCASFSYALFEMRKEKRVCEWLQCESSLKGFVSHINTLDFFQKCNQRCIDKRCPDYCSTNQYVKSLETCLQKNCPETSKLKIFCQHLQNLYPGCQEYMKKEKENQAATDGADCRANNQELPETDKTKQQPEEFHDNDDRVREIYGEEFINQKKQLKVQGEELQQQQTDILNKFDKISQMKIDL